MGVYVQCQSDEHDKNQDSMLESSSEDTSDRRASQYTAKRISQPSDLTVMGRIVWGEQKRRATAAW